MPDRYLSCGEITLDTETRQATCGGGAAVTLSPSEAAILGVLIARKGREVSVDSLCAVARTHDGEWASPEVVSVHLCHLRRRLPAVRRYLLPRYGWNSYLMRNPTGTVVRSFTADEWAEIEAALAAWRRRAA